MNNCQAINWDQLSLVIGEENEPADDEMRDLYKMFVEDASQRLRALREPSVASQPENVAKEAHKIRGAASSFGFEHVAGILRSVETQITELNPERIEQMLHTAVNSFEQSVAEVNSRYPNLVERSA